MLLKMDQTTSPYNFASCHKFHQHHTIFLIGYRDFISTYTSLILLEYFKSMSMRLRSLKINVKVLLKNITYLFQPLTRVWHLIHNPCNIDQENAFYFTWVSTFTLPFLIKSESMDFPASLLNIVLYKSFFQISFHRLTLHNIKIIQLAPFNPQKHPQFS